MIRIDNEQGFFLGGGSENSINTELRILYFRSIQELNESYDLDMFLHVYFLMPIIV